MSENTKTGTKVENGGSKPQSDGESSGSGKSNYILIIIIAVLATFIILRVHGTGEIIKEGMAAPDFELERVGGGIMKLSDQKGKVVVLNFWATWCPPCVEEMPSLERLHRRLEGKDFILIAVSIDNNINTVERFIKQFNITFSVLHDPGGQISEMYGTYQFPETFIIGRDGTVMRKEVGAFRWDDEKIVEYLEGLK